MQTLQKLIMRVESEKSARSNRYLGDPLPDKAPTVPRPKLLGRGAIARKAGHIQIKCPTTRKISILASWLLTHYTAHDRGL